MLASWIVPLLAESDPQTGIFNNDLDLGGNAIVVVGLIVLGLFLLFLLASLIVNLKAYWKARHAGRLHPWRDRYVDFEHPGQPVVR